MNKLQKLTARLNTARSKGNKSMWYMVLADTVVDVLAEDKNLTRETLAAELKKRQAAADNGPILEESYALAAQIVEQGFDGS